MNQQLKTTFEMNLYDAERDRRSRPQNYLRRPFATSLTTLTTNVQTPI